DAVGSAVWYPSEWPAALGRCKASCKAFTRARKSLSFPGAGRSTAVLGGATHAGTNDFAGCGRHRRISPLWRNDHSTKRKGDCRTGDCGASAGGACICACLGQECSGRTSDWPCFGNRTVFTDGTYPGSHTIGTVGRFIGRRWRYLSIGCPKAVPVVRGSS